MTTAAEQLAAWQEAGLVEVDLPSGFKVRVRQVTPAQLVTSGLLPYDLIGAMVGAEEGGTKVSDDVIGRSILDYVGSERTLSARAVRDIWNGEAWERIDIPPGAFADGSFPPDDVEAIVEAAMAKIRAAAAEGAATSDLAAFRDDGSGPVDRPDGGAVRATPVEPRRDRRAAGRAAARRGDRSSPRPG